jgi:hypothetical protein
MKIHLSLLAAGALLALGACQEMRKEEARFETAEAVRTTAAAEEACVAAVAAQTGVDGITVTSAEESDGNAEVLLNVPGTNPWLCLATVTGNVVEVSVAPPA